MWVARWKCVVASGFYFGVTSGARLLLLRGLVTAFPSSTAVWTKLFLAICVVFWFVQSNTAGTPWNWVSNSGNPKDFYSSFSSQVDVIRRLSLELNVENDL